MCLDTGCYMLNFHGYVVVCNITVNCLNQLHTMWEGGCGEEYRQTKTRNGNRGNCNIYTYPMLCSKTLTIYTFVQVIVDPIFHNIVRMFSCYKCT